MMRQGNSTTTSTGMAQPEDLTSPEGGRPWEDRTLPSQERYDAYMSVVREKCEALRESLKREGVTDEEKRVLAEDPNNKALVAELRQIQGETAEEFCDRLDGELMKLLGPNFLGAGEWQQGFNVAVGPVPPIPKWITKELLEGDCELHPGQRVKDTHILVLIPKSVDGEPYSALKLGELCAKTKGSGEQLIFDDHGWANRWKIDSWAEESPSLSEWVLVPKSDPDPSKVSEDRHFRRKSIAEQADVYGRYAEHYREAKALEVMTAALLNDVVNGERILSDCHLCTQELNASGGRVVVGYFHADGLLVYVDNGDYGHAFVGGALARKSKI